MDMQTSADFDTLDTQDIELRNSRKLAEGLVLVDEFGISLAFLCNRVDSPRPGAVRWYVQDVDTDRLEIATFSTTLTPTIKVAAGVRVEMVG